MDLSSSSCIRAPATMHDRSDVSITMSKPRFTAPAANAARRINLKLRQVEYGKWVGAPVAGVIRWTPVVLMRLPRPAAVRPVDVLLQPE